MKKLILPLIVLFTLGLAACDKKPADPPKPKSNLSLSVTPAA